MIYKIVNTDVCQLIVEINNNLLTITESCENEDNDESRTHYLSLDIIKQIILEEESNTIEQKYQFVFFPLAFIMLILSLVFQFAVITEQSVGITFIVIALLFFVLGLCKFPKKVFEKEFKILDSTNHILFSSIGEEYDEKEIKALSESILNGIDSSNIALKN